MKSAAKSGALTDKNNPLFSKRDKHVNQYYEVMKNSKSLAEQKGKKMQLSWR
jgi:hypothetical protein